MAPRAEIWFPGKVGDNGTTSQQRIKEVLTPFGGQVLEFRTVEPVEVSEISPLTLVQFLEDQSPKPKFSTEVKYPEIFTSLRQLPPEEQERLLIAFYTEGVQGFPNGETLGKQLAKINNIPWFEPSKKSDFSSLQNLAEQTLTRLNFSPLPIRVVENDWVATQTAELGTKVLSVESAVAEAIEKAAQQAGREVAQEKALTAARGAARNARGAARRRVQDAAERIKETAMRKAEGNRNESFATAVVRKKTQARARGMARSMTRTITSGMAMGRERKYAEDAAREAEKHAQLDAELATAWTTVEDLMPQEGYNRGNPFELLIEIYNRGCWPIGIVLDKNGQKAFAIFVP